MPPKLEFRMSDQDYYVAHTEALPHRLFELSYNKGTNRWELRVNKKDRAMWTLANLHIMYQCKLETKLALGRYLLINFNADMVWEP